MRRMTADDLSGSLALRLAAARIALYSAHTNLDAAPGGVSCALATLLGVEDPHFLVPRSDGNAGMGAIGPLGRSVPLGHFLADVAARLETPALRYVGLDQQPIRTVAVCGGAGAGLIADARAQGADVFVTADISYHRYFEVLRPDGSCAMALVDAGHYESERHAEALLCTALRQRFPNVRWKRPAVRTSPVRSFIRRREH